MAKKVALLIGVSDYELGLNPLPGAVKDVDAMKQVLLHPEICGFAEADVTTLHNPDRMKMEQAIETVFSDRQSDDLVLLYFSGHGVKDDNGKLFLATRQTIKNQQGELIRSSAVAASTVHDIMSDSRSKRQVVILDCCYSGAFADGLSAKDDGRVPIRTQLGGKGRGVLTSSTSTQYSFEQQGSDLSIYTRYLIEGLETGAADRNSDGLITIDELHEYAKRKVQEAAPAMKPQFYPSEEGYRIKLAKAPLGDPKLIYQKEVERYASKGEISSMGLRILNAQQEKFKLSAEEAREIEAKVLKPYQERQKNLQEYEQALTEAIEQHHPLSEETRQELLIYQEVLSLRDEDIAPIEARIIAQKQIVQSSVQTAESTQAQTTSRSEDVAPVKLSVSQSSVKGSVASQRNYELLIGAGIATALVSIFAVGSLLNKPTESDTPVVSSTVSTDQMTAKEFYDRGLEKANKEDYKGAIEDYNEALRLSPNYVIVYYSRGYARNQLEDYKEAIEDLNQYIQKNPKDAAARSQRGLAYKELHKYDEAIADLNKAIEINSKDAYAYNIRGIAYKYQGNYAQAISDYSKAIELKHDPLSYPYYNRGTAHYNEENYKAAIEDYSQAISLDPNYALAYYNRGYSRTNLGQKQEAIADFKKAAELYQKQGDTNNYQDALNQIKELQKSPNPSPTPSPTTQASAKPSPSSPPPDKCRIITPTRGTYAQVFSQPLRSTGTNLKINKGIKVWLLGYQDAFVKVKDPNDTQGWIFNDQIKPC